MEVHPEWISWFYESEYLAGYVFIINLLCSLITILLLLPELTGFRWSFDWTIFRPMLHYSTPLVILGVAGILNQAADKILYPFLVPGHEGEVQLGIYGAATKIAMIVAMFTQAFRYAYEPLVFGSSSNAQASKQVNADGMKYFVIFSLLAFLMVVAWLDIFKVMFIRNADYWEGLRVVPIVMMAEIFMGIYFNLSFWYKLIDQTHWGAIFSLIGCTVLITINIICVPIWGYEACAWASFSGYGVCMLLSFIVGQKKNPVPYDLRAILVYIVITLILYAVITNLPFSSMWIRTLVGTLCVVVYVAYMLKSDFHLTSIMAKLRKSKAK